MKVPITKVFMTAMVLTETQWWWVKLFLLLLRQFRASTFWKSGASHSQRRKWWWVKLFLLLLRQFRASNILEKRCFSPSELESRPLSLFSATASTNHVHEDTPSTNDNDSPHETIIKFRKTESPRVKALIHRTKQQRRTLDDNPVLNHLRFPLKTLMTPIVVTPFFRYKAFS
ncbi:leishmanolysin-like peptidase isoform X1 [Sesbania bispinosa]|nr:leishmanolysin-like peptidase isoform X1 [Sesbania bispinosa]